MTSRLLSFLFLAATLPALTTAQQSLSDYGLPERVDEPPRVAPAGCSISELTDLTTLAGSDSYLLLRFELQAMEAGHRANKNVLLAMAAEKKSDLSSQQRLVRELTALDDAKNSYLCGSFVIGKFSAHDEEHTAAKTVSISIYNRFAKQAVEIRSQFLRYARDAEEGQTTSGVQSAEDTSSVMEDHKDTQSDLKDVTRLSAMLLLDTNDNAANKVSAFNISCRERSQILVSVKELAKEAEPDEFTNSAHLLQAALTQPYTCHQ